MDSQLAIRTIEAVRLLHRLGYRGLRILPGINASGTAWRIVIFNVTEWRNDDKFGAPYQARETCLYSTAAENVFNNEVQFPSDVSHISVAEAILDSLPSLQRSSMDETGNREYVQWYAQLASRVDKLTELPVAYADYFDSEEGWELGWGSNLRFPPPPAYAAANDRPAETVGRDEF